MSCTTTNIEADYESYSWYQLQKKRAKKLHKHLTSLNFMVLNCQSLNKKASQLKAIIFDNKIDVLLLQETWLTPAHKSVYSEFQELGFKVSKLERHSKKGGGLATLINSNFQCKIFNFFNYRYDQFDNIVSSFNLFKHKFTIVNLYRPPDMSKSKFLPQFNDLISKIIERDGILIVTGDFNINLLEKTSITDQFLNILKVNGLTQLIKKPTRKTALLDFIIIPLSFSESFTSLFPNATFISDHRPLFLNLIMNSHKPIQPQKITINDFDAIDLKKLRNCVINSPLQNINDCKTSSETVNIYNSEISKIFPNLCPSKTIIFKHDKSKSWFNSDMQKLKQQKRKFERLCRKSPRNELYKNKYKESRNAYTQAIKKARINYYSEKIKSYKGDSKNMYKVLNELCGNQKNTVLPSIDTENVTAEKLSVFYVEKVENIRKNIYTLPGGCNEEKNNLVLESVGGKATSSLESFNTLSITEIKEIVKRLKKKFCFLDPAPISVVMQFLDLLYPIIQKIVNESFVEGEFPKELKCAEIIPILKNPSLDPEIFKHFRPVSRLPFVSKVIEQAMYEQLNTHLQINQLYSEYQSAYRRNHSCETAMTKLLDDIQIFQSNIDNNSILILLD